MASVLHRTTKQYIASAHTPDYPVEDWIHNPDMSPVSGVPSQYWKITGDAVSEMSAAEKDAACLSDVKAAKCAAIDARTDELITAGFTYNAKTFSLSQEAQARLTGINQVRDDAAVTYPVVWNTIDDGATESLADAAAVLAFYLTALGTYRGHVDGGTTLKDQVRAAATVAAVEAITDSR
jgi:hypothetical protein